MGVNTSIGPATRLWQDAASELTPAKSLARINDNAKFLAGSVTIVGTLFTGFGLLTIDAVERPQPLAPAKAYCGKGSALRLECGSGEPLRN
jgi:hypothetical protein